MPISKTQLIVALDNMLPEEARQLVSELSAVGVSWFKVGLELFTKTGPSFVRELKAQGLNVFLDLKLHDIPNTVMKAVSAAAETGADLLTIHTTGGTEMMAAAQKATQGTKLKLLGVTVLTSFSTETFAEVSEALGARSGSAVPRGAVALRLAEMAAKSGLPGIVCSVSDLHDGELKKLNWSLNTPLFVTPGIRNSSDASDDQKSVATVSRALLAGSTHIVVGRPIIAPAHGTRTSAAQSFLKELKGNG